MNITARLHDIDVDLAYLIGDIESCAFYCNPDERDLRARYRALIQERDTLRAMHHSDPIRAACGGMSYTD
jgi:hypothetical protein